MKKRKSSKESPNEVIDKVLKSFPDAVVKRNAQGQIYGLSVPMGASSLDELEAKYAEIKKMIESVEGNKVIGVVPTPEVCYCPDCLLRAFDAAVRCERYEDAQKIKALFEEKYPDMEIVEKQK